MYVAIIFLGFVVNGALGVVLTIELSDLLASAEERSGNIIPKLDTIEQLRNGLAGVTVSYKVTRPSYHEFITVSSAFNEFINRKILTELCCTKGRRGWGQGQNEQLNGDWQCCYIRTLES